MPLLLLVLSTLRSSSSDANMNPGSAADKVARATGTARVQHPAHDILRSPGRGQLDDEGRRWRFGLKFRDVSVACRVAVNHRHDARTQWGQPLGGERNGGILRGNNAKDRTEGAGMRGVWIATSANRLNHSVSKRPSGIKTNECMRAPTDAGTIL